jgi:hypothetical protein
MFDYNIYVSIHIALCGRLISRHYQQVCKKR